MIDSAIFLSSLKHSSSSQDPAEVTGHCRSEDSLRRLTGSWRHHSFSQDRMGSRTSPNLTNVVYLVSKRKAKKVFISVQEGNKQTQTSWLSRPQRTGLILISRWRALSDHLCDQLLLVGDYFGCLIGPQPWTSAHHLSIYNFTFTPLWLSVSSIKIKMLLRNKFNKRHGRFLYWRLPNTVVRN